MSGYVQVSKPNNGRQHGCIQDTKEETEEKKKKKLYDLYCYEKTAKAAGKLFYVSSSEH